MALKRTRSLGYTKFMGRAARLARFLPPTHQWAALKAIREAHYARQVAIKARA